jgi:hypothetical protein
MRFSVLSSTIYVSREARMQRVPTERIIFTRESGLCNPCLSGFLCVRSCPRAKRSNLPVTSSSQPAPPSTAEVKPSRRSDVWIHRLLGATALLWRAVWFWSESPVCFFLLFYICSISFGRDSVVWKEPPRELEIQNKCVYFSISFFFNILHICCYPPDGPQNTL